MNVLLEKRYDGKIEIASAKTLVDVLKHALVEGDVLVGKMEKLVKG